MSGVWIMPGETALTRIVGAYSSAALAVSATTAAFAAEYGASPADGRPEIDAVLTIAPPPPARMCGTAALKPWKTPVRLRSTMRRHSSTAHSCTLAMLLPPALL